MSAREALDLIGELTYERSHLMAAVMGWSRPASVPDLHLQMLVSTTAGQASGLPWPWGTTDAPEPVSDDERAAAAAHLARHSAIPD